MHFQSNISIFLFFTTSSSPSSKSTTNRRVHTILDDFSSEAIFSAAFRSFKAKRNDHAANILKLLQSEPDNLSSVQDYLNKVEKQKGKSPPIIKPAKALSHKYELGWSKRQYEKTVALG